MKTEGDGKSLVGRLVALLDVLPDGHVQVSSPLTAYQITQCHNVVWGGFLKGLSYTMEPVDTGPDDGKRLEIPDAS